MPPRQRQFGHGIALAGILAICLATLWPAPSEAARARLTPISCIACGDLGGVDLALNVLLFVPLGVGLALAGFSVRRSSALAFLASFTVELLQLMVIPGRDASLGDLIANTSGGCIGAVLGAIWPMLVWPELRLARRLALGTALTLCWIWAGTAWALGPSFPEGVVWFGGWAPEFSNYASFRGRVLMVTAGGEPLLPGPALDTPRLEDAVTADPTLRFTARLGPQPSRLAPIGVVVDGVARTVLLIGQRREDLLFGYHMRASILRLRNPLIVLAGGLEGASGDTITGFGTLRDGVVILGIQRADRQSGTRVPLNASWGWSLIAPWQPEIGRLAPIQTAVWIAAAFVLLGYWSSWAPGATLPVTVVTWIVVFVLIPAGAAFQGAPRSDWAAAVLGTGIGIAVGRLARRARHRGWSPGDIRDGIASSSADSPSGRLPAKY